MLICIQNSNHLLTFQKGRDSLNGRFFAGRTVQAQIYDQMLYEEEDFSH